MKLVVVGATLLPEKAFVFVSSSEGKSTEDFVIEQTRAAASIACRDKMALSEKEEVGEEKEVISHRGELMTDLKIPGIATLNTAKEEKVVDGEENEQHLKGSVVENNSKDGQDSDKFAEIKGVFLDEVNEIDIEVATVEVEVEVEKKVVAM